MLEFVDAEFAVVGDGRSELLRQDSRIPVTDAFEDDDRAQAMLAERGLELLDEPFDSG